MAKQNNSSPVRQFVSQEDIDRVLDAAIEEQAEAEGELELGDADLVTEADALDFDEDDSLGLISNDEIQALLRGDSSFNTPPSSEFDLEIPPGGSRNAAEENTSQLEIDALLKEAAEIGPKSSGEEAEGDGLVAQSEIDALLQGDASAAPADASSEGETESDGLVSQSDIDALLQGDAPAAPVDASSEGETESDGLVSQSEIDALLQGDAPDAPVDASSEEAAQSDGLVSQSDIDALLQRDASDTPAGSPPEGGEEAEGLISQSSIDDLLNGELGTTGSTDAFDASEPVSDISEPEGPPESRADAAASKAAAQTAQGVPFVPQEADENGNHVSQSDIDALLREAMASDEVSEGSSAGDADEQVDAENQKSIFSEGIDSLLEEQLGAGAELEPVILAEETEPADSQADAPPLDSPWYRKRHWRVSAMAAIVMMISSISLYALFRSPEKRPPHQVLTFAVPNPDTQAASGNDYGKTAVTMPGFMVLAPDVNHSITCVTADVSLDFSDPTIAGMVKDNAAFVRNVIYRVIAKALATPDKEKINKISIGLSVREALATVVPKEAIRAVFFDKFKVI